MNARSIVRPHRSLAHRRSSHLLAAGMMIAASVSMAACEDDAKHPDPNSWIVSETMAAKGATAEGLPEVGAKVSAGMRIATAKGQFLYIQDGRSQVMISAASTVTISDTDPAIEGTHLDLASGSLQVKPMSGKPAETMAVSAPHVMVIIHGSTVAISASPEQSIIYVSEGVATVSSIATGDSATVYGLALATQDGIEIR
jgi:hypothetical protein